METRKGMVADTTNQTDRQTNHREAINNMSTITLDTTTNINNLLDSMCPKAKVKQEENEDELCKICSKPGGFGINNDNSDLSCMCITCEACSRYLGDEGWYKGDICDECGFHHCCECLVYTEARPRRRRAARRRAPPPRSRTTFAAMSGMRATQRARSSPAAHASWCRARPGVAI